MYSIPEPDYLRMKKICSELWEEKCRTPDRFNPSGKYEEERGLIAPLDLLWVFRKVKQYSLPTTMCSTSFGFKLAFAVYGHHELPPTDKKLDPRSQERDRNLFNHEPLITITENHLPFFRNQYGRMSNRLDPKQDVRAWQRTWKLFSKLTHSESNRNMIEWYQLPVQREASYYQY